MPWTKMPLAIDEVFETIPDGMHALTYSEALNEAQAQALELFPEAFLIGEGIDDVSGVFRSTLGLARRFPGRVFDSPISENAVTGICGGAAAGGMRPILIHMRVDFALMSMDQIVNHIAKWRFLSGGQVSIPLVIRAIIGRGWGSAAQHSQGLHGLFMQVPGLKIIMPSTPYDAKGLLLQAVADANPVLCIEHRWLYNHKGLVSVAPEAVPFGHAIVRTTGTDITIVAVSYMVYVACKAAKRLEAEGIHATVVDVRTLCPLDMEAVFASLERTRHLIVADVAPLNGGLCAEILARVAETMPDVLASPARRIGFPFMPTPASPVLEEWYYPDEDSIYNAAKEVLHCQ